MKSNIFIIVYLLLNIFSIVTSSTDDTRSLDYYFKNKIYSIEENENNYKVVFKEIIFCFVSPCDPLIIDTISIEDLDDIRILKALFDKIFMDSEIKLKRVVVQELSDKQIEIISDLLERNHILNRLEYEIINGLSQHDKKYTSRGVYYEKVKDGFLYTIGMGQQPSSGYSIDIQKIKIKGKAVTIYVNEKKPGNDEGADMVITYPIVQIKFNLFPSQVTVLNYENGKQLPNLFE